MRAQFAQTLLEVGKEDSNLVLMVGDIGAFGQRDFAKQYPGRFYNFGIREQSMLGAAAGLALTGFIPVVHSITPFLIERCFEQIKDNFSYQEMPVNLVSIGGGMDYSALGATHHSYSDLALMKSLPRTKIFVPGSAREFDCLFKKNYLSGSVNYFRLSDQSHGVSFTQAQWTSHKPILLGSGADITLITMGPILKNLVKSIESLLHFCTCDVIYLNCIKPLDSDLILSSLEKTKKAVVVENHSAFGGLADEVRRVLSVVDFSYEIHSLAFPDAFLHAYGNREELEKIAKIDTQSIIDTIRARLS